MAGEDRAYVTWIRSQPCAVRSRECRGPVQAHHAGRRALSRRAHDETCVPLCMHSPRSLPPALPPFDGGKDSRRTWADTTIRAMQTGYVLSLLDPPVPY
jgi:hypothetical protein